MVVHSTLYILFSTKGAFDKTSWKIIQNTTSFDEKLEKNMGDLMKCFIIFWVFY